MSNFFINSSEILTISLLNNKSFYFNLLREKRGCNKTAPALFLRFSVVEKIAYPI